MAGDIALVLILIFIVVVVLGGLAQLFLSKNPFR